MLALGKQEDDDRITGVILDDSSECCACGSSARSEQYSMKVKNRNSVFEHLSIKQYSKESIIKSYENVK